MPSLSVLIPRHVTMIASQTHGHCFENRSSISSRHLQLEESKEEEEEEEQGEYEELQDKAWGTTQRQNQITPPASQPQLDRHLRHIFHRPKCHSIFRLVILLAWILFAVLSVVDAGSEDDIVKDLPFMDDIFPTHSTLPVLTSPPKSPSVPLKLPANAALPTSPKAPFIDSDHFTGDDHGSTYDPPYRIPGLTQEEYEETWNGKPDTIKIGILLPFTPNALFPYMTPLSRISLSVCAVQELFLALCYIEFSTIAMNELTHGGFSNVLQ